MRTSLVALTSVLVMTVAEAAPVDLSEVLAPPPTADFVSAGTGSRILDGAFDSRRYASWLTSTPADADAAKRVLDQQGFTRGFARTWGRLSPKAAPFGSSREEQLVETVEEYGSGAGAQSRFSGIKSSTPRASDFLAEIESAVPNSYGAVAGYGNYYFVMFVKGNDVYIVRLDSEAEDLRNMTADQAAAQFKVAPPYTIPPGQWTTAGSASQVNPIGALLVVVLVVGMFVAAAGGLIWLAARRRRGSGPGVPGDFWGEF